MRNRRVVWILALLVALAAGLWLYLRMAPKPNRPRRLVPGGSSELPRKKRAEAPLTPPPPGTKPVRLTQAIAAPDAAADQGIVEGTVRSARDGAGVDGAELTFSLEGAAFTTRSERGGHFTFKPPRSGTYQLQAASAQGFFPYAPEWGHSPIRVTAQAGARLRNVDLYLNPAVTYAGRVVDPSGKPVAGAEVRVIETPGDEQTLQPLADARFTADAQGAFRFQAPAFSLLEARHPDFLPGRARLDVSEQAARAVTLRLLEKKPGALSAAAQSISGRVRDTAGAPVEGALVTASPEQGLDGQLHPTRRATSDAEGRFTVEGLDEGAHTLTAAAPPLVPARQTGVRAGATDVVLQLDAGARLFGTVRDAKTGQPIPAFTVQVSARDGLARTQLLARAFADPDGHYEMRVPAGELAVTVAAYGYAPSEELALLASLASPARGDVRLSRGGRIFGKVVDEQTHVPLANAQLSVEGLLGSTGSPLPVVMSATTNAAGEFSLEGLAAGLRSVMVAAQGHHTRLMSGLNIQEDGSVGPLTVELAPTEKGEEPRTELVGIGAVLKPQENVLQVVQTMPQGGAAEAGIVPGDAVLRIDGQDVGVLGFEGAVNRIRGVEGSTVRVTLKRAADGQVVELPVVRRRIRS